MYNRLYSGPRGKRETSPRAGATFGQLRGRAEQVRNFPACGGGIKNDRGESPGRGKLPRERGRHSADEAREAWRKNFPARGAHHSRISIFRTNSAAAMAPA